MKYSYALFILLIITILASGAYAISDTNLLSYYKLDETAGSYLTDSVGALDLNKTAGVTGGQTGVSGTALHFNSSTSNAQGTPSDYKFLTDNSAEFSVTLWAKYPAQYANYGSYTKLLTKGKADGTGGVYLGIDNGGGTGSTGYFWNMTSSTGNRKLWYESNSGTDNNAWHFWVVACKANDCNVFIDGSKRTPSTSHAGTYSGVSESYPLFVGADSDGARDFYGYMDELSFWKRALTATDVTALYNSGNGLTYPFDRAPIEVDFNVYRNGTTTHLTDVNLNCNVNTYDSNGNTSPFSITTDQNTYVSCQFIRTGYDSNTQNVLFDSNKTQVILLSDTTKPVTTLTQVNGTTGWNKVNVDFNLSCSDAGSGCASTQFMLDNNSTWFTYTSGNITINADKNWRIDYNSKDNSGNTEVSKQYYIAVDKTAPVVGQTTIENFTTYNVGLYWVIKGTGNIFATATDATSGIASYDYNTGWGWNTTSDSNAGYAKKNNISITDGNYYMFNLRATDNATNVRTGTATTYYIGDTLAPTTSISGNTPTWISSNQTITLSCADNGGAGILKAGCNSTQFMIDNNGTWFTYSTPFTLTTDGNHRIDYNSKDNLGTTETTKQAYAAIDKTAPSVGQTYANGFNIAGSYIQGTGTILASITDNNSGVNTSQCEYTIDNGANWYSADGNATYCYKSGVTILSGTYKFNLRGKDNVGNQGLGVATIEYSTENTPPVTNFEITDLDNNANTRRMSFLCTDANAGCARTQFMIDNNGTWFDTNRMSSDHNSTEVQSTQAAYKIYDTHVFTKIDPDLNGTATHYLTSITNQIRETSSATAKVLYHIVFMDGTDQNTEERTNTGTYSPYTYTTFNHTKDVNYVETWMACTSGTTSCYYKDTNFIYTELTPFYSYTGTGHHYVDYNSTDAMGNVETTKRSDINMPVLLTVLYPKNVQNLVQLTEKWTIQSAGGVVVNLTDLNTAQYFYVAPNVLTTFNIADVNGNYTQSTFTKTYYADTNNGTTDTLQPYLYSIATSLATIITTVDSVKLTPIPGVSIKIYGNIPGIGKTLIGEVITDYKGEALQLFVTGQTYEFKIYYLGAYLRTDNITALNSSIQIPIKITQSPVVTYPIHNVKTSFIPSRSVMITSDVDLNQTVTVTNNKDSSVQINSVRVDVYNTNWQGTNTQHLLYSQSFLVNATTYTNSIDFNYLAKTVAGQTYDTNGQMIVYVTVDLNNGEDGNYAMTYSFPQARGIVENLSFNLRPTFGCPDTPNDLIPCGPMLLFALFISLIGTIGIAVTTGFGSMESMGIIFLLMMGIFVYLAWVPVILYGLMILAVVLIGLILGGNRL